MAIIHAETLCNDLPRYTHKMDRTKATPLTLKAYGSNDRVLLAAWSYYGNKHTTLRLSKDDARQLAAELLAACNTN